MSNFWKYRDYLPAGTGYAYFSRPHLFMLSIISAVVLLAYFWSRHVSERSRWIVLKIIPLGMIGMEIFKDYLLDIQGADMIGYLPLQLCSLGVLVFIFAAYVHRPAVQRFFGEVACTLIAPGAIAALLFPNWNHSYMLWSIFSIHSYSWHTMLLVFPVIYTSMPVMQKDGRMVISIKHIWYAVVFLCAVVPPVMCFDKKYDCNYMFLNWPSKGSPLVWIADRMGNPGYLVGFAILVFAILLAIYLLIEFLRIVRSHVGGHSRSLLHGSHL
ncbi:MAG: YwaF family protein [Eubacterium sp.]|jgi:uncharacterized protein (DUF983 family)|nr:YwaF family protein [Eubacterium sp.]MCI2197813.1 YwaF family protein [Eubacterium sp.]